MFFFLKKTQINARTTDQSGVPVKVFHTMIWVQIAHTFIQEI